MLKYVRTVYVIYAIISCSLNVFCPIFEDHFFVFKGFFFRKLCSHVRFKSVGTVYKTDDFGMNHFEKSKYKFKAVRDLRIEN